jgi:hypothetical protein
MFMKPTTEVINTSSKQQQQQQQQQHQHQQLEPLLDRAHHRPPSDIGSFTRFQSLKKRDKIS